MAARREKKPPIKIKTDGWVTTFGDLISLMLTFFVLIVSMSTLDDLTLKDVSSSFSTGAISVFDNASNTDIDLLPIQEQPEVTLRELMLAARQKSNRVLQNSEWQHKVKTLVVDDKFILRMPNSVLFESGQVDLKQQDIEILKRLARLLASIPGDIRVEGHTSSETLPENSAFPDAWSLSLARAASVLHVLETEGVSRSRLSLVGYGPSKPISTNSTPYGRSKNQRVDIVLYQPSSKERVKSP
ncbi:MAG: motb protein [Zetaproteobacteria bacterium CG12_big_fil_rev_8_21_14_0_65_55_1124]|nr:MAG: motb protein [Zetaproteobacteria bacterium CG1_02_55_237]PIS18688.1 MAG: motb protein [Zetaproteobacteria bacterium CG08_land_8_20_14_0_20_55_17]PIW43292.1 MAG: motb protein [Zetaproteobacteria bacterium CG12_big_fil_rev_8_21_14_0_65_55_1124]PIY53423.1 MAG: motb protein [Zetaproteobacteria bacterium CG_4_10_14_0_8_um_filter_55_43]PIZ38674.1 MAG: motb protein [Zetaproteobacteria bacterium CG_4_10_14_0_2_um_filter_55_20]PJB82538.1 MAG: motb protein [Zetaproteobacteria bacterium CG_4_9_14